MIVLNKFSISARWVSQEAAAQDRHLQERQAVKQRINWQSDNLAVW
jgi:hypothetical protein